MLKIVYFASLKERLGIGSETLELQSKPADVAAVIALLVEKHGDVWQDALQNSKIMTAVNQEMCDLDQVVVSGDEIAFFPPVTGG